MAALALVPPRTLYTLEETVAALIESADSVTPELEAQFVADLQAALSAAKEKRDDIAHYMSHCESQMELAQAEIARLRERKAAFEKVLERLRSYVVKVMEAEGIKKLEGNTVTFSTRKCPVSIEVFDETAVPRHLTHASITVPGNHAEEVIDALPVGCVFRCEYSVDKADVKRALDTGASVPGAKYAAEKLSLVRK